MFQFLFCYILERKDKKWFKRDIIVLISFLILFVSISFLINIGKEMSLTGFRIVVTKSLQLINCKAVSSARPKTGAVFVLDFVYHVYGSDHV